MHKIGSWLNYTRMSRLACTLTIMTRTYVCPLPVAIKCDPNIVICQLAENLECHYNLRKGFSAASNEQLSPMGSAVRVRSAGQKYGPTCHQRDRADVTEFVTLVRLSSLGQHVGVLALAGYKRRKSALTAGPISYNCCFQSRSEEGIQCFCSSALEQTATGS